MATKTSNVYLTLALGGALALAGSQAVKADKGDKEKCAGISKAGKNDCAAAGSSCAGTSKVDNEKGAWIYLPKGVCDKIVGGEVVKK